MNFGAQKSRLTVIEIGIVWYQAPHKRKNSISGFPNTTYKIAEDSEIIVPKIEGMIHPFLVDYPVSVSISAYSFCNQLQKYLGW